MVPALVCCLLACADDPTDAARPRRLSLSVEDDVGPPPAARVVRSFDFSTPDRAGFSRRSDTSVLLVPLGFLLADDGPSSSVFRRVRFDAGDVTELRVSTQTAGDARLRFEWLALDGEEAVGGAVEFRVDGGDHPRLTEVDLSAHDAWRGRIEGVSIQSRLRRGPVVLAGLDFTHTPLTPRRLMDRRVGDGLFFLGAAGRRGAPLVSGRGGLLLGGDPGPGAILEFSVGLPAAAARREAPAPELVLSRGGEERRIRIERKFGWTEVSCAAPGLAGSDAGPVRMRLEGAQGDCAYVTEPWIAGDVDGPASTGAVSVLLITADTLRRDFLPMYGDTVTRTPALMRLAARGTVFDDVTSSANVTVPSHATILSALHPKDHGCTDNITGLSDDVELLPERLRDEGFATGACVAATVLDARTTNLAQGFSEFADCGDSHERPADRVTDDALDFLARHDARPFFLWVHYYDPHMPYRPPDGDVALYYQGDPRDPSHGPPLGRTTPHEAFADLTDLSYPVAQYRAEITFMDRHIGRLLDAVWRKGRPVLVCFVADHGESLTENGIYFNHEGLFPNTVRVPWILAGPGVPVGARDASPRETVDVTPTILRALGLAPPASSRGVAYVPSGPGPDRSRPRFFQHSHQLSAGMRTERFHAILHLKRRSRGLEGRMFSPGDVELYLCSEAEADGAPDRSAEYPEAVAAFRREVARWLADTAGLEGIDEDLTEERERALRELGYLGGG